MVISGDFQGCFFFFWIWIIVLAIIILFPQVSLWLQGSSGVTAKSLLPGKGKNESRRAGKV